MKLRLFRICKITKKNFFNDLLDELLHFSLEHFLKKKRFFHVTSEPYDHSCSLTDTGLCGALRAMRIVALEFLSKNEKRGRNVHERDTFFSVLYRLTKDKIILKASIRTSGKEPLEVCLHSLCQEGVLLLHRLEDYKICGSIHRGYPM